MYKTRFNNILTGLIFGLILPTVTLIIVFKTGISGFRGTTLFDHMQSTDTFVPVISLCTIPNLLSFFVFIWTNRLLSARGVLLATFIVALIIISLKFIV
jgi:hypothetical protein